MTVLEDQTNGRTRKIGRSRNPQFRVRTGLQQPATGRTQFTTEIHPQSRRAYLGSFLHVDKVYLGTFSSLSSCPGQHYKKRPHYIQC